MKKSVVVCVLMSAALSLFADKKTEPTVTISDKIMLEHAAHWVQESVLCLSPEQIELIANLLYVSYNRLHCEVQEQLAILSLRSTIGAMDALVPSDRAQAREISLKMASIDHTCKELFPIVTNAQKAHEGCLEYITDGDDDELQEIVHEFHSYLDAVVKQYIAQDQPVISRIIDGTFSKFKEAKQKIEKTASRVFETSASARLNDFSTILSENNELIKAYDLAMHTSLAIKKMQIDLLNIRRAAYSHFYQTLYQALATKKMLPVHIIFDEKGLIPSHKRNSYLTALTNPNLKTTT